jgi:hypothetical protein
MPIGQRSRGASTRVTHRERGTDTRVTVDRSAGLALATFIAVEVGALALWLTLGRDQWFFSDEWDFLAGRTAGDLGDLFHPHDNHWSTLPILVYRALWWVFGLRTYLPYLVLVVLLHLTVAALLRAVMRRAGVGPWFSTAAASLFALFGAGYGDIVWAFQIGFNGSLVFGLTQLLLADHDGPVDRRDWFGLVAGFAGLLCSGVAVSMVIVVGLATLVRRGRRVAALHTVPLGLTYLVWWISVGREDYANRDISIAQLVRFVRVGVAAAFDAMGQVPGIGLLLGILLIVGLVLAWGPLDRSRLRARAAAPGALLAGAVVFLLFSGFGRASLLGPEFARASRYQHVITAMALPALAVAANAVARRWRVLAPLVLLLLLVGIPGNVRELADYTKSQKQAQRSYRHLILSVARAPMAKTVPRTVRPDASLPDTAKITVGWLLDGVASGRLPDPGASTAKEAADNAFRLSLEQSDHPKGSRRCRPLGKPVTLHLNKGDSFGIREGSFAGGSVRVSPMPDQGLATVALSFNPERGNTLAAVSGPLAVRAAPGNPFLPVLLCDT